MKHDGRLDTAAARLGLRLSPAQIEQLSTFESLLAERAVPMGFIGHADLGSLRERHVLDSLRAAPHVAPGLAADLGSGAGLPGIVIAIARPDVEVDLVESQRRRLAFLELAVERLALPNAVPIGARVEELDEAYHSALARAFGDLARSWRAARRVLGRGGRLVYFAGARFRPPIVAAEDAAIEIVPAPALLASSGPLVIMTRQ